MVVNIHTSERNNFRRCRRRWFLTSPNKMNLRLKDGQEASPLWLGSGFHFALEDYHGHNRFGDPMSAFEAYRNAFRKSQLPDDVDELFELGMSMLGYYTEVWLPRHQGFKTWTLPDGEPAVEVNFNIALADGVEYGGTFDRIVEDEEGRLWVMDYKTAARIEANNLETDSQVSSYTWAARHLFGDRIEGCIWLQFLKKIAKGPARLADGVNFSKNKAQKVSYGMYYAAVVEEFGSVPKEYVDHLNWLAEQESEAGDEFIQQRLIRRSQTSSRNAFLNMIAEAKEMMDPDLTLYPNPTRDCQWDCSVRSICITMDDGFDWENIVEENYEPRVKEDGSYLHAWRDRINWPD